MHDGSFSCRNLGAEVLLAKDGVGQRAHHVAFYSQCPTVRSAADHTVDDDAADIAQGDNPFTAASSVPSEEDCTPAPHPPARKVLFGQISNKSLVCLDNGRFI